MFAKKILVVSVLATAFATIVGCGKSNGSAPAEDGLAESADGMLGAMLQSTPSHVAAKPSPVTCSGDQNNGGRKCCDATHCCININGTIRCDLGPEPTKK